ncbi:MAG: cupin domain-containing protein [Methylocystis sp.]
MSKKIEFSIADHAQLRPAPINPEWIIEGAPFARNALLSKSADDSAFTLVWDCTRGLFDWHYSIDETVFILEGSVMVEDEAGVIRVLEAGATAFFPAGSRARWRVETYVRKVAFCRKPMPRGYVFARDVAKAALEKFGFRKPGSANDMEMFSVAS